MPASCWAQARLALCISGWYPQVGCYCSHTWVRGLSPRDGKLITVPNTQHWPGARQVLAIPPTTTLLRPPPHEPTVIVPQERSEQVEGLVQGRTASLQGTGLKRRAAWFPPFHKGGDMLQLFSLEMAGGGRRRGQGHPFLFPSPRCGSASGTQAFLMGAGSQMSLSHM